MNAEQQQWGQIVAKAWQDDAFKKRLLSSPASVLAEVGLVIPAGLQVRVVENTERLVHLTIPAEAQEQELSDDDLEKVAGGALAPGLVGGLARVFGWNSGQINQILDADYYPPSSTPKAPTGSGPANDRSPPGPA